MMSSIGRVLAEEIVADRDFPPFNRVCMDGICLRREDFDAGMREFFLIGVQAAGSPVAQQLKTGEALEIMTGAILPESADCVVRYEDLKIKNDQAIVLIEQLPENNNIHPKGMDKKSGEILILKNKEISSVHLSVLATIGQGYVKVYKRPRIAIVSTGNELVDISSRPEAHQIRRSNAYAIEGLIRNYADEIKQCHLTDNQEDIRSQLSSLIREYNIVVLSGGVSKGKFDFLPKILEEIGVEKSFHGVSQRPGKPFWFGQNEACRIFALPGNPMSSITCSLRYLLPFLRKTTGLIPITMNKAILNQGITFRPSLTRFIEAKIEVDNQGQLVATPLFSNGSGDFTKFVETNGIIELPSDQTIFEKGELISFFYLNLVNHG